MVKTNKSLSVSLPENLVLIEEVKEARYDPTKSDTARILLLKALASMCYLQNYQKKALGACAREKV